MLPGGWSIGISRQAFSGNIRTEPSFGKASLVELPNVPFGSLAAPQTNDRRTAAIGGKADTQQWIIDGQNLNVCFHLKRTFKLREKA